MANSAFFASRSAMIKEISNTIVLMLHSSILDHCILASFDHKV